VCREPRQPLGKRPVRTTVVGLDDRYSHRGQTAVVNPGPGPVPIGSKTSHLEAADESSAQGDLVGVIEVAANRQPAREPRHGDAEGLEEARQI